MTPRVHVLPITCSQCGKQSNLTYLSAISVQEMVVKCVKCGNEWLPVERQTKKPTSDKPKKKRGESSGEMTE